jgi:Leucine-rich repeat (LRR) protein
MLPALILLHFSVIGCSRPSDDSTEGRLPPEHSRSSEYHESYSFAEARTITPDSVFDIADYDYSDSLRGDPSSIVKWKKLQSFTYAWLDDQQAPALFSALCQNPNLTHLDFTGALIDSFPREMCSCTGVRSLILEDCNLRELPVRLRGMKDLERLSLRENRIARIPNWIADLKRLRQIDVAGNFEIDLDQSLKALGSLPDLRELIISDPLNDSALPQSIGKLRSLRYLRVEMANSDLQVPPDFGNLDSLERLDIIAFSPELLGLRIIPLIQSILPECEVKIIPALSH